MRVYAPSKDGFNGTQGYLRYFIASSHLDVDELTGGPLGWSECIERFIADRARKAGYTVFTDYWNWYNRVDYCSGSQCVAIGLHHITYYYYCESSSYYEKLFHVYLNNGNTTYIYIPP